MRKTLILPLLLALTCAMLSAQTNDSNWSIDSLSIEEQTLKINEILINPISGGADYIEIFNSGYEPLRSDDFCLVRWIGDSLGKHHPLPAGHTIQPHSLVVLTTDTMFVLTHYTVPHPDQLLQMASMPPYPNSSGTVLLYANNGALQDRFDYDKSMHNPLLSNEKGVALERSSLSVLTNAPENWHSASKASGYGTPTGENSQNDLGMEGVEVLLSSPLLSPDGDGYQDQIEITCLMPLADLLINITLFNSQGRIVRHLTRNAVCGTLDTHLWNGLDDSGILCPRGTYIILIEIYNNQGLHFIRKQAVSLVR